MPSLLLIDMIFIDLHYIDVLKNNKGQYMVEWLLNGANIGLV